MWNIDTIPETDERVTKLPDENDPWWSMSARTQIILIAAAIGLFNCLLIAIFAAVFFLHSG